MNIFDKMALLTRAMRIVKSFSRPSDAYRGKVAKGKVQLMSPITSYLTGEDITEVDLISTAIGIEYDGRKTLELYAGYQYITSVGRSPIFLSLSDLEDYLHLMLFTYRETPMQHVAHLDEVFLSDYRTGLYAVMPKEMLRSLHDAGRGLDNVFHVKSVEKLEDIFDLLLEAENLSREAETPHIVVRLSMTAWKPVELELTIADKNYRSYLEYKKHETGNNVIFQ